MMLKEKGLVLGPRPSKHKQRHFDARRATDGTFSNGESLAATGRSQPLIVRAQHFIIDSGARHFASTRQPGLPPARLLLGAQLATTQSRALACRLA